jgi:hypothetical protein
MDPLWTFWAAKYVDGEAWTMKVAWFIIPTLKSSGLILSKGN